MERVRAVIAGLDISTRMIALVVLNAQDATIARRDEFPIPEISKLANKSKAERCRVVATTGLAEALSGVTTVYVEQPMGRQIKGIAEVERVVGAVIANIPDPCAVSLITPGEWKKSAGLNGNANKEAIALRAVGLYPSLDGSSQDILDAAMIARACWEEGEKQWHLS